jgi:uncharacterized protein (DUF2384 family)
MSDPKIPPELIERAERIFGNKEAAREWFERPDPNLLGRRPIDEIEAGGEALVAMALARLEPPEEDPHA